jgi:hypothetical protein
VSTKASDPATPEITDADDVRATAALSGWVNANNEWTWGDGITTFDGERAGIAVALTPTESEALKTNTSISLVETREEIYNALAVSAQTSVSYGLSSASATASLAQKVKTTGYDLYLVMTATAYSRRLTPSTNVALTEAASDLLQNGEFVEFVAQYGNRFVDGMQFGGIYAGILEIHAQSTDALQEISASLSGAIGTGALDVTVEGKVSSTIEQKTSLMTTKIVEEISGGGPQSGNVGQMMARALGFGATVTSGHWWPLYVHLADYTKLAVPNRPAVAAYLKKFAGPEQILEQRRSDAMLLSDRLTDAEAANEHPESYADTADNVRAAVSSELDSLPGLIAEISAGTSAYVQDMQDALARGDDPTTLQPTPYTVPAAAQLPGPQPGLGYTVRSGTGYVVAQAANATLHFDNGDVEYDPALVLADADDTDVNQRWMLGADPPAPGKDAVITLVNGASKQGVSEAAVGEAHQPVAFPWSGSPIPGWDIVGRSDGSVVIRAAADHTANFNALEGTLGGGNPHAGTPIGLYAWGGGNPNELWYLDPIPPYDPG